MKKWKDIPRNEKWMIALMIVLLIGVILRWTAVKDGIFRGFNWFGDEEKTEDTIPGDSIKVEMTLPSDTFPVEKPEVLLIDSPENE